MTTTLSDFKKDVTKYLSNVSDDYETLIVNLGNDNGIVIISLDEYNSLRASQLKLSLKANERRIDSAIDKVKMHQK